MRVHKTKTVILKKSKLLHKLIIIAFLGLAMLLLIGYVIKYQDKQLEYILDAELQLEENKSFLNNHQVISITGTHIKAMNWESEILWEDTLIHPAAEILCKAPYFLISNEIGSSVSIYGPTGYHGNVLLMDESISLDINNNGDVVVLSKKNNEYKINKYLKNGEIACTLTEFYEKGVYPTMIKINSKGNIVALCSVDINSPILKSTIGIFKLDKESVELVQVITEADNLIHELSFQGRNIHTVGDKQENIYSLEF